jgi:hypothetical protein
MFLSVDTILWIYLQNVISLPYDYLIQSEPYEIFHAACEKSCKFIISANEIYDDIYTQNTTFHFNSFRDMIQVLQTVLPSNSKKKYLIDKAFPIIERLHIEFMLDNLNINSKL